MPLQYVGVGVSDVHDLTYRDYVEVVKSADLTTGAIDTLINNGLASYVDTSYVDTQDALNATQAYVDAGDAGRLKLANKNIAGGIAGLDSTSHVAPNLINVPLAQTWHRGPWVPSAYHASPVVLSSAETTVFSCPITDPGYPYRLLVFGEVDMQTSVVGEAPILRTRVGNATTGAIIATGEGLMDSYASGINSDDFERTSPVDLGPDWTQMPRAANGTADTSGLGLTDGWIATPGGHDAAWVHSVGFSQPDKRIIARRTKIADAVTPDDIQVITMTLGSDYAQDAQFGLGLIPSKDIYGRMSSDCSSYSRMQIGQDHIGFYYNSGSGDVWDGSDNPLFSAQAINPGTQFKLTLGQTADPTYWKGEMFFGGTWSTIREGHSVGTSIGASNRGWGFGMTVKSRSTGALPPFQPQSIAKMELASPSLMVNSAPVRLISTPDQSAITGATTLYIRALRSGSAATIVASTYQPRLYVMAVPA